MEDSFVRDILTDWGIPELIDEFNRQKIDREVLLTIPEEGLTELISVIGWKYTFIRKRKEYLQKTNNEVDVSMTTSSNAKKNNSDLEKNIADSEKTTSTESNQPSVSKCSNTSSGKSKQAPTNESSNTSNGKTLIDLLKKNSTGVHLIKKKNKLESSDRNDLTRIIIEHQLLNSLKIDKSTFLFWTAEIKVVFPNEDEDTYYICYKQDEQAAAGKLYDKYTNLKRKFKSIKTTPQICPTENVSLNEADKSLILQLQSAAADDHLTIKDLWIKTHSLRMNELNENKFIDFYLTKYPMLKEPVGTSLINLDFMKLDYVEDGNIFIKKWPEMSNKLIQIAKRKPKETCCSILKKLSHKVPSELKGLIVLPYLFAPTQVKSENEKKWKPSYQEQADSFIFYINDIADLQQTLDDRAKHLKKHRSSSQPFIVAVGDLSKPLEAVYVVLENTKYKFQNILSAVDLCFKSFFAFDLKYPAESQVIWIFIERSVYNLSVSTKKSVALATLMTAVKSADVPIEPNSDSSEESS